MKSAEAKQLAGCCGLFCGLCSKHQSPAASRCLGCQVGEQHSWCSIWNCCVKKHGYENCAECPQLSGCAIFSRRKVEEWVPALDNLHQIKVAGLAGWLKDQHARQRVAEKLLSRFNEGRSMSFYCKACARMPVALLQKAISESAKIMAGKRVPGADLKTRAAIMKTLIAALARDNQINLK